ncbi:hypothetical protein [Mycobacterium sp. URHB0021]|jgi:hypothetical protein
MGLLGTAHLISLLIGLVAVAALGGFAAATVAQRSKRRARGHFVAGLVCGLLVGVVVRRRYRGVKAFASMARRVEPPPRITAGMSGGARRVAAGALAVAVSHARRALSPQWVRQLRR